MDVYEAIRLGNEREINVLIVEDEPGTQIILSRILSGKGCNVDVCGDAFYALQNIRKKEYDLIVIDWNLPLLNGLGLLRQFEKYLETSFMSHQKEATPFVLCTGEKLERIRLPQFKNLIILDIWEKKMGWGHVNDLVPKVLEELKKGVF